MEGKKSQKGAFFWTEKCPHVGFQARVCRQALWRAVGLQPPSSATVVKVFLPETRCW